MSRTALATLALILPACGSTPPGPPLSPVTGRVFFRGEPAAGAVVTFHPVGNPAGRIVQGVVAADGTFALTTTTAGDGAAPGKYAVCLSWTDVVTVNDVEKRTPDKFGKKYDAPDHPHSTFEVKPGPNDVPRIDLN